MAENQQEQVEPPEEECIRPATYFALVRRWNTGEEEECSAYIGAGTCSCALCKSEEGTDG